MTTQTPIAPGWEAWDEADLEGKQASWREVPSLKPESDSRTGAPRVMLLGYNGANNTGAEALLLADIEDVRAVLGPEALITVPTLNPQNLRRYVQEGPNLRIAQFPSLFFFELRRLVRQHDLVILVEGSSYMDTWGSALLWAFLWTTRCAHAAGKPCLAYAVDAGQLSSRNQLLTRHEASKTDLIVARSAGAADRLRSWGVRAPMEVTADNAFTYQPIPADAGLLHREWPEATSGIVGLAAVDFHLWPVVMRPWGRAEDCYRWPYYFSRSPERRRASIELAEEYAALADRIVEEHHRSVALIGMEQVDETLATSIQSRMRHPDQARVFSSRVYDASQMTVLLRGLDLLVTSRYHASVLSLASSVPQVAVGHDLRLLTLYRELGLADEFFIDRHSSAVFEVLRERVDLLLAEPTRQRAILRRGHDEHLTAARRNRDLLHAFVTAQGFATVPPVPQNAEVAA
jgi:polysaccharide pyruvyl transferase WcaK-like protein